MNKTGLLLVLGLGFIWVNRLPAPIVEEQAKPTPAPAKSEAPKPKAKPSTKARTSDAESSAKSEARPAATPKPELEGPARFTGTWSGKIKQGVLGHVPSSVTVDSTATSVELSHNLGGTKRRLTINGNTISWKTGVVGEVGWTLTPNSDGQTAEVTMKGVLMSDSTTFRRGSPATTSASQTTTPPQPRTTSTTNSAEASSAAGGSMNGPRPKYSQAARDAHLSGTGTYLLHFDTSTGAVTYVTGTQSSGSAVLDQAAIDAFRQWHAQPNGKKEFPLTISFP
jgi:TonB family protein